MRKPIQPGLYDEMIVDNFAGGGGASTGIEQAIGRPIDIAINHDPEAVAMHKANHPFTKHYCESVFDVDPKEVARGRKVGLAWFSPDCKHFSKAKGGAQPPEILSTHPADTTRINNLNKLLGDASKVYQSSPNRYGLGENLY